MVPIIVSYFSSPKSSIAVPVVLDKVMHDFKYGKYARQIIKVREVLKVYGDEAYKEAKKNLPAIAFCGEFSGGHAKQNLIRYNNLLVFDIDHLSDEEMKTVGNQLANENKVMAFWVSPSGNGFKGLIKVVFQNVPDSTSLDDCYKKAFIDITTLFVQKYGIQLDVACSDYSRICYVCWDEQLLFREEGEALLVDCSGLVHREKKSLPRMKTLDGKESASLQSFVPVNIKGKNAQRSRIIVSSIIKFLTKRNLSITSTYNEWLRVGFAIASTFNYDLGVKYYLELCRLDKEKHDEEKSIEKLQECYMTGSGEITLGTIIEMARNKGYIYKGSSGDS